MAQEPGQGLMHQAGELLRRAWERAASALAPDMRDLFVFGGLGAACYGIAQLHHAAAWIFGGVMLMVIGWRN